MGVGITSVQYQLKRIPASKACFYPLYSCACCVLFREHAMSDRSKEKKLVSLDLEAQGAAGRSPLTLQHCKGASEGLVQKRATDMGGAP